MPRNKKAYYKAVKEIMNRYGGYAAKWEYAPDHFPNGTHETMPMEPHHALIEEGLRKRIPPHLIAQKLAEHVHIPAETIERVNKEIDPDFDIGSRRVLPRHGANGSIGEHNVENEKRDSNGRWTR